MTARAEVVIMFPWNPIPIQILRAIDEENRSFMKLFTTVIKEASAQQTMLRRIVNMSLNPRVFIRFYIESLQFS
jgi:hypothetical protein